MILLMLPVYIASQLKSPTAQAEGYSKPLSLNILHIRTNLDVNLTELQNTRLNAISRSVTTHGGQMKPGIEFCTWMLVWEETIDLEKNVQVTS